MKYKAYFVSEYIKTIKYKDMVIIYFLLVYNIINSDIIEEILVIRYSYTVIKNFKKWAFFGFLMSCGVAFLLLFYFSLISFFKVSYSSDILSLIFFSRLPGSSKDSEKPSTVNVFVSNLLFYLFVIGTPWFMVNLLPYYIPIFKEKIFGLIAVILVWLWTLFWFIVDCLEMYIILAFALDSKYIKISDGYPKFIKDWLSDLEIASHFKSEAQILRIRVARLLIMLLYMLLLCIPSGFILYWYFYL